MASRAGRLCGHGSRQRGGVGDRLRPRPGLPPLIADDGSAGARIRPATPFRRRCRVEAGPQDLCLDEAAMGHAAMARSAGRHGGGTVAERLSATVAAGGGT
jgi:hypothetical protein